VKKYSAEQVKTNADISAGLFSFIVIPDPDNPAGVTGIPTGNVGVLDGGEIDFGNWSFTKQEYTSTQFLRKIHLPNILKGKTSS